VPEWWPKLLLFVFVTHMPFFARAWWRSREVRYLATTVTFALLIVTYALRVFVPDAALDGIPLFWWVRVAAWLSAALSIGLLIHHRLGTARTKGG